MFCKYCGKEIQEEQEVCLNCGSKNPDFEKNSKKKITKKTIISLASLVIFVFIVFVIAINSAISKPSSSIDYQKLAEDCWIENVKNIVGDNDSLKSTTDIRATDMSSNIVNVHGTVVGDKTHASLVSMNFKKTKDGVEPITNDEYYQTFKNDIEHFVQENSGMNSSSQNNKIKKDEKTKTLEPLELNKEYVVYNSKTGEKAATIKIKDIRKEDGWVKIRLIEPSFETITDKLGSEFNDVVSMLNYKNGEVVDGYYKPTIVINHDDYSEMGISDVKSTDKYIGLNDFVLEDGNDVIFKIN